MRRVVAVSPPRLLHNPKNPRPLWIRTTSKHAYCGIRMYSLTMYAVDSVSTSFTIRSLTLPPPSPSLFSCCCSCSLLNANPRPDGEGGRRRTTGDERNVVAVSECADGDSTSTCSLPSWRRRRRRRPAGFDLSPTTAAGGGAQRGKKIFSAPAPLRPSGVRARHSQSASQRHSGRRPPFLPRVGGRERAEQRARRRPPSPLRPPKLSRRSQRRLPSLRLPVPVVSVSFLILPLLPQPAA